MDKALQIQEKLNALQQELHKSLVSTDEKLKEAQAKLFEEREKLIQEWTKQGGASSSSVSFWAQAIISGLELYDKESDENVHFLGPYDVELLSKYLLSMKVEFSPHSQKLILEFKENPFFEETSLWAELHYALEKEKETEKEEMKASRKAATTKESQSEDDEDDEEEEDEEDEDQWTFSGITWKPGHGPEEEEDEDESQEDAGKKKRARTEEESKVRGPSMLGVFSIMPPHPNNDQEFLDMLEEEFKDEDIDQAEMAAAEELEDAIQSWESEMDHRDQLLSLLVDDIYVNPVEAILAGKGEGSESDEVEEGPSTKKSKPE